MDFSFTEDQDAVRGLAEQVFTGRATVERVKAVEATEDRIDRELWKELGTTGLLGIGLPEAHGGAGLGLVEVALVLQQQGRRVAPVPYWPTVVLGALTIAEFGTEAQQARWLPAVAAGEVVLTAALEPAPGGEALVPTVAATPDGDGWRLDGTSLSVPALPVADAVLVPAVTDDGPRLFLVPTDAPGSSIEAVDTTSRARHGHLTLTGTPAEALEDDGGALSWLYQRALVGLAAMQLGVCEEAIRLAAEYTSEPRAVRQGPVHEPGCRPAGRRRLHRHRGHPGHALAGGLAPRRGSAVGRAGRGRPLVGLGRRDQGRPRHPAPPRGDGGRHRLPRPPLLPVGQAHR